MSEQDATASGRCNACGFLFVFMDEEEYQSKVSQHILSDHRDEPIDKPLVSRINGGEERDE